MHAATARTAASRATSKNNPRLQGEGRAALRAAHDHHAHRARFEYRDKRASGRSEPTIAANEDQVRQGMKLDGVRRGSQSRPLGPLISRVGLRRVGPMEAEPILPTTTDFSSLPRLSSQQPKILFRGIDFDSAIPAFHRPSSPSTPLCVYRDELINMRAMPTDALPTRSSSPFPASLRDSGRRTEARTVQFGVIASKSNVSNLAVERATARKRFKAALQMVTQRSMGLPKGHVGVDYLTSDWSYTVFLSRGVYEARMGDLCDSVSKALKWIKKLQDCGIGTDRQRPVENGPKMSKPSKREYKRRDA